MGDSDSFRSGSEVDEDEPVQVKGSPPSPFCSQIPVSTEYPYSRYYKFYILNLHRLLPEVKLSESPTMMANSLGVPYVYNEINPGSVKYTLRFTFAIFTLASLAKPMCLFEPSTSRSSQRAKKKTDACARNCTIAQPRVAPNVLRMRKVQHS